MDNRNEEEKKKIMQIAFLAQCRSILDSKEESGEVISLHDLIEQAYQQTKKVKQPDPTLEKTKQSMETQLQPMIVEIVEIKPGSTPQWGGYITGSMREVFSKQQAEQREPIVDINQKVEPSRLAWAIRQLQSELTSSSPRTASKPIDIPTKKKGWRQE